MNEALFRALLQIGDDSLVLAQRLCEWSGHAPTIEVDLSLSNLALDLFGQATMVLDYAGAVEGAGRDADRLAFHRNAEEFRNSLLVEQPNGDFAQTIARQFLYSAYASALYEGMTLSSDVRIAEIASKAIKEVRYHLEFAREWLVRLGDGTEESHQKLLDGFVWMNRFNGDLFCWDEQVLKLVELDVLPDPEPLRASFDQIVREALADANILPPENTWPLTGGRRGLHSEHLSMMLAVMQVLPRAHPEAVW